MPTHCMLKYPLTCVHADQAGTLFSGYLNDITSHRLSWASGGATNSLSHASEFTWVSHIAASMLRRRQTLPNQINQQ